MNLVIISVKSSSIYIYQNLNCIAGLYWDKSYIFLVSKIYMHTTRKGVFPYLNRLINKGFVKQIL